MSRAGTWVAFQSSYTRGTGAPVTVTDTFTLLNPATQYTLTAFNGGLQNDTSELVSNSVVYLNGTQVVGPANFNQNVAEVNVTISPGLNNTLSVQVRGKPGGVLTIQVVGVDNDRPTITASLSPSPNAAGWNNSPVTISFTCSDNTSGVASCPSPITVNTEGANQVFSGTATDLAGNTASASVTINLDMTPPTVTGSINPPPDAGGYNSGPVTVTFTCADALSGVASCSSPVSVTQEGTAQVPGTATDVAGNTASTMVAVNISFNYFKIRSWQTNPAGDPSQTGKCLDYGISPTGNAGVFLNDCSAAHLVRVMELPELAYPPDGHTCQYQDAQVPPNCFHHEVLLYAGKSVLGLNIPQTISQGGTSGSSQPATEYDLDLQPPFTSRICAISISCEPVKQIWRLDGDSIILEGIPASNGLPALRTPCLSTDTYICSGPPPQLVIQVQNARGANGSPLVAAVRNLADNEFWDFIPSPNSRPYPTAGFQSVATADQLWNALCSPSIQAGVNPPQTDTGIPPYACSPKQAWGSVIEVSNSSHIDLSPYPPVWLGAGVTLRGNRRGLLPGPQLYFSYQSWQALNLSRPGSCNSDTCMFEVHGDYVRVIGLRLRGESRATDTSEAKTIGVQVDFPGSQGNPPAPVLNLETAISFIATIDHNEGSDWGESPVEGQPIFTYDPSASDTCTYPAYKDPSTGLQTTYPCDQNTQTVPYPPSFPQNFSPVPIVEDPVVGAPQPGTLGNIHVARNFLHHNLRNDGGYGASVRGRAFIEKNTFVYNRHDISADAEPHNEYRASNNLVLSSSGLYQFGPLNIRLQDFDMHGTDNKVYCVPFDIKCLSGIYFGGAAGFYVEIDGNTFLSTDGNNDFGNYLLRGQPAHDSDYLHNVSLRSKSNSVQWSNCVPFTICFGTGFPINISSDNQFADSSPPYTDPTTRFGPASLGVGDFDGDGDDDLFLATGVAWFFSPAGKTEWRFLNAAPQTIDQLLFGDFDGDGRTDVVTVQNGQLVVSWGGISAFELLNPNPLPCASISDMAVGDFDGDGSPDIFCADGMYWWISFGGSTPFVKIQASKLHGADLRFGDFNNDRTTDVFSVQSSGWQVSYSPKSTPGTWFSGWQPLPGAPLTTSVAGLVVADFNGDGFADVLASSADGWQISYGGLQPWTTDVPQPPFGGPAFPSVAGVGHFTGQRQADVLVWDNTLYNVQVTGLTKDLLLSPAGASLATPYSTQDMR